MGFCPGAFGMLWRDGDVWEVHARGAAQSWAQVGVIAGKNPWRGCVNVARPATSGVSSAESAGSTRGSTRGLASVS